MRAPTVRPGVAARASERGGQAAASAAKNWLQPSAARGIPAPDPNAEHNRHREGLLAETKQLERDVDIAWAENQRILEAQVQGAGIPEARNATDIISLLGLHLLPPDSGQLDPSETWLQAASTPMAFLPFSKPGISSLVHQKLQPPEEEEEEEPISHLPIQMTAEEELPYLQAFTPLMLESSIAMVPSENRDEPLMQRHLLTATSSYPAGLFAAQIVLLIDTESLTVKDLGVPHLDPAARPELGPFIERIVKPERPLPLKKQMALLLGDQPPSNKDTSTKVSGHVTRHNVSVLTTG